MPSYLQKGPTLSLPANKTTQTNVTFGVGNGSDVNFTVTPPTGFSYVYVNTIYRTDWQGTVALSASPRTNTWLQSTSLITPPNHPYSSTIYAATGITDPKGGTSAYYINEAASKDNHLCYQQIAKTLGSPFTFTIYLKQAERTWAMIQIESGLYAYINLATGVVGTTNGITSTSAIMRADGWVKVVVTADGSITGIKNVTFGPALGDGIGPYLGVDGQRILAFHPKHEPGSISTSDIPTASAPVTLTDYTVSGLTYTLAETPLTGAILSYSGYSYTAAYVTFDLPSCGSISISSSGLTSGKLRITASVDGANFNPAVILPIDEATGALATSSDLPNGFYTLNVKPFKSVRFTQTDVTDTVTISTALGR